MSQKPTPDEVLARFRSGCKLPFIEEVVAALAETIAQRNDLGTEALACDRRRRELETQLANARTELARAYEALRAIWLPDYVLKNNVVWANRILEERRAIAKSALDAIYQDKDASHD